MQLTLKQINLLLVLAKGRPIVAPWDNGDLCELRRPHIGMVESTGPVTTAGKAHSSNIWTITEKGKRFLVEERGVAL